MTKGTITERLRFTTEGIPAVAKFVYRSNSPYAVELVFPDSHTWMFARDLLHRGLIEESGEGDVRIYSMEDIVQITLRPPGREAVLLFDLTEICNALSRTEDMIPSGEEPFDFDAEIGKIAARHD